METKVIQIEGTEYAILPNGDLRKVVTAYGRSTWEKPKTGMFTADRYYEMDTKNVYLFDAEAQEWLLQ